ncbi:hypothetical protein BGZ75_003494 [Mortierella antarctica]|nr:hypothetical protein BGZ75_003494 [Mortierella antarctica]
MPIFPPHSSIAQQTISFVLSSHFSQLDFESSHHLTLLYMLEINLDQDHATQQHVGGNDGIEGHHSGMNSDVFPQNHDNDDNDDDLDDLDGYDEDNPSSSLSEPILLPDTGHQESEASTPYGGNSEPPLDHDMTLMDDTSLCTNKSRLPVFKPTSSRTHSFPSPPQDSQAHALNCLEVENAFLLNQNNLLSKDMHHCRETVQALKQILQQREDTINRMKEEYDRACMKTRFMESLLAEHSAGSLLRRADLTPSTQSTFDHSFQPQEGLLLHIGCDDDEEEEMSGDEESDYDDEYIRPAQQDLGGNHYQEGSDFGDDGEESDMDDSESEAEANVQDILQEIPRNTLIDNTSQDPSTEPNRTLASRMYQQPNSTYRCDPESPVEPAPSHSPKTLRRRPSLKATCTVNLSIQPVLSIPSPPAPHTLDMRQSISHSSLSFTSDCSDSISSDMEEGDEGPAESLRQEGSEESDDGSFHSVALKDSGHFPITAPRVEFIEVDLEHDEPSTSLFTDDDCDQETGKCTPNEEVSEAMQDLDRVIQNPMQHHAPASQPQPQQQPQQLNGHPYLKASPVAIASTLLSCIHVEASASSTTLTTESSTSLDMPHFKSPAESDQDCESQATSTSSAEESMNMETSQDLAQGKTRGQLGQRFSYASTSSLSISGRVGMSSIMLDTTQTLTSATSSLATLSRDRAKVDDGSEGEDDLRGMDVEIAVVKPHALAAATSKGNSTGVAGSSTILGFRWSGTKFVGRPRSGKAKEKAPAEAKAKSDTPATAVVAGPGLEPALVDTRTTPLGHSSGSILSRLWVGLGRQKSLIRANRQPSVSRTPAE